jgi:hypothetical protein
LAKTQTSSLFWKNSYVGYYEIDDIMSFSPDSILERRKNKKGKGVLDYSMSQITQIVGDNNGRLWYI